MHGTAAFLAPGGRRILLSSNCQAGSVAAVLSVIFPTDQISVAGQPEGTEDATTIHRFSHKLQGNDIWIRYVGVGPLGEHPLVVPLLGRVAILEIPHINFYAFHPDLFYAFRAPGVVTDMAYNSGIVAWGYRNRVEPDDVRRLFNCETFAGLGYLSCWDASVGPLHRVFTHCGLDFATFFMNVKRQGIFMHTVNHPRMETVIAFAKCIAMRLGAGPEIWERRLEIADAFASCQWPVYPEIGRYLAVPGEYDWVEDGAHLDLPQFIGKSFDHYRAAGIDPSALELNALPQTLALFDRVLCERVRKPR